MKSTAQWEPRHGPVVFQLGIGEHEPTLAVLVRNQMRRKEKEEEKLYQMIKTVTSAGFRNTIWKPVFESSSSQLK
jgi:hypothetical protein